MKVLISGEAGVAVVVTGDRVVYLAEDIDRPRSGRTTSLHHLFANAVDIVETECQSESDLKRALLQAWKSDRALQLLQYVLGPRTSTETRRKLALLLDELLSDGAL